MAETVLYDTNNDYLTTKFVLNKEGKVVLEYEERNKITMGDQVHSRAITMNMYEHWKKENTGISFTSDKSYVGYMNLKGEIFIDNANYRYGNDFSENRVFVSKGSSYHKYLLLNEKGKRVGVESFSKILGNGFKNGFAVVEKNARWGVIDKEGKFVAEPTFSEINSDVQDGLFLFAGGEKSGEYDLKFVQNRLYGIANTRGEIILKPILKEFDRRGFVNGLLMASLDKEGTQVVYINKQGKIVWQSSDTDKIIHLNLDYFNIDYMNRGYFYANSDKTEGLGGWGKSDNYAKDIIPKEIADKASLKDSIVMWIDTENVVPLAKRYKGRYVFVSNVSDREIELDAQDSRLYAKMQALNQEGKWQDIEYLPSSWCGNSYHTITLKPNHTWKFLTPIYKGTFKTQLRLALIIKNNYRDENKSTILYSKPVNGSINLSQFWRKPDYFPRGLMDPYFD